MRGVRERREKDRKIVWGTEERKREDGGRKSRRTVQGGVRKRGMGGEGARKV